MVRSGCTKLS